MPKPLKKRRKITKQEGTFSTSVQPSPSEATTSEVKPSSFALSLLEVNQQILSYLDPHSLLVASQVSRFWYKCSDEVWIHHIKKLIGNGYKKPADDRRSYKEIYFTFVKEFQQLSDTGMDIVAKLIAQKSVFDVFLEQDDSYDETDKAVILVKLELLTDHIVDINGSNNLYPVVEFLITKKANDIPLLKSLFDNGFLYDKNKKNDSVIEKYKDNTSQTPRFTLAHVLIKLDDAKTLELLASHNIASKSYYHIDPLQLAVWCNSEQAFGFYQENFEFKEPSLSFVALCASYNILPQLNPRLNQMLMDNQSSVVKEKFIARLLIFFEKILLKHYTSKQIMVKHDGTNEIRISMLDKLNEKEREHPISVCFGYFAAYLEETNNDVKLAEQCVRKDLSPTEYEILKTVEFFLKNDYKFLSFPDWFIEILEIVELYLRNEQWETTIHADPEELQGLTI